MYEARSEPWPYMLRDGLTSKPSEVQQVINTRREGAKMGRYGTENGLAKAAGHFSQLLGGKAEAVKLYVVVAM